MSDKDEVTGSGLQERRAALVEAVQEWAGDCEGHPQTPSDARLLKAIWTYEGDSTKPCEGCDGECDEPCAPCTVAEAHASLDRWIADYEKRHGITNPAEPSVK